MGTPHNHMTDANADTVSAAAAATNANATTIDLLALPRLALEEVLAHAADSLAEHARLRRVCQRFRELLADGAFFHAYALRTWPLIQNAESIQSWERFVQRRHQSLRSIGPDTPIENCLQWEYECPIAVSQLQRSTTNPKADFCNKCNENVYLCNSIEEIASHVSQKHCVAFDPEGTFSGRPLRRAYAMMGRVVRYNRN